jgi:hypothetical protein
MVESAFGPQDKTNIIGIIWISIDYNNSILFLIGETILLQIRFIPNNKTTTITIATTAGIVI